MITIVLILCITALILLSLCRYCYWYAFKRDAGRQSDEYDVPKSGYREKIVENIVKLMQTPFEDVYTTSHDGLKLYGRYYHFNDNAPLVIIFHGYRSNAYRDGNGGFQIAKNYGLNVLIPDQRSHGKSEGTAITFGIKESYDCAQWIDYSKKRFGNDIRIVLVGLSMGAATVMMASDKIPAENVKGIIADCGFSSPKEILKEVAKQMKYPCEIAYFLTRMGAKLFGGFDVEESSALEALAKTSIPLLFIHGESDGFVPCYMSRKCYEACASPKQIFTVKDATHGVSYYLDTPGYTKTVTDFFDRVLQ